MAEITASLVKELREKTGAGMMDCKKALTETDGDIEKRGRLAAQEGPVGRRQEGRPRRRRGLVGVAAERHQGRAWSRSMPRPTSSPATSSSRTSSATAPGSRWSRAAISPRSRPRRIPAAAATCRASSTNLVATIGENMTLRRAAALSVSDGVVATYIHNAVAPDLGKIGVLVALESTGDKAKLRAARPSRSPCTSPRPTRRR